MPGLTHQAQNNMAWPVQALSLWDASPALALLLLAYKRHVPAPPRLGHSPGLSTQRTWHSGIPQYQQRSVLPSPRVTVFLLCPRALWRTQD